MLSLIAAVAIGTCDLGKIFAEKQAWEESAVDFTVDNAKYGFEFASQKRDIVNCLRRGTCTWHGIDVWEARIYYGPEGARRVEMSLYNRGDDKTGEPLGDADLQKFLASIASKVEPRGKIGNPACQKLPDEGYSYTKKWDKVDPTVELTWGVNNPKKKERVAQFVRVTLCPKDDRQRLKRAAKPMSTGALKAKFKANVTKNNEGDVWIQNVPMVDQGQKGYCAAAVGERVMRYFGHEIDEHEIAQIAGTEAKGGTSVDKMVDTVKLMASKKHLGYEDVVRMSGTVGDIEKEVAMYNKAAKAEKAREIDMGTFTKGCMIDVGGIRAAMKPKILKKMRVKDSRYKKFLSTVKTQIDQGVPILWGVTLGMFPEPGIPQSAGGHMRLIIGYNQKTNEILFTDTWGAGHELKRMPEDWAFAITHDAFFLRPL